VGVGKGDPADEDRGGGRGEEDDGGDENVDEEGAARERL